MRPTALILILCVVFCGSSSGCRMFQYLHPHQMWKLNRQPGFGGDDAYFRIPPLPVPAAATEPEPDNAASEVLPGPHS